MESKSKLSYTDFTSSIPSNDGGIRKLYYPRPREGQIKEWKWDEDKQELCIFVTQVKEVEHTQTGSPKTVVTASGTPTQETFADVKTLVRFTIEVMGLRSTNCKEMCRSYFENKALSGGHITHLTENKDSKVVFITFESRKDAERVVRRSHVINGCHVTVKQCIPLNSTYPNKLLLRNVGDHTTDDQVSMYLKNITGLEPCEILTGEQPGVVIVQFDEHINFNLVKEHCETITMEGRQISVSEVPISNCVLVKNLAPGTTEDDLVNHFMSNVGSLEWIEIMPSKNKCLVYFEDISAIDLVLTQTHKINGRVLNLQHCLELPGPSTADQTYDFIKPKPIRIKNIQQDMLTFIKLSSKFRNDLSHELLSVYAKFEVLDNMLTIDCTLTSSVPMAYALARTWTHYVQLTIEKYMTHLEVYRMKTLRIVWDFAVKSINEINRNNPDSFVDLLQPQETVIVVIGKSGAKDLFEKIITVVENTEMEIERKKTKVRETNKSFQVFQLRLLQALSSDVKIGEQYKDLCIDICFIKSKVTLTGLFQDVKEFLVEMVKLLQLVKHYTINDLCSTIRLILCSTETRVLLVEKFKKEHVIATWEEEKDSIIVYAFSDKECMKAANILLEVVVKHEFSLKGGDSRLQILKSDEWKALALKLMKTHPGKLNISYSPNIENLLIILTLTADILDTVRENISFFFQNHVFSEEYSFSPSRHKFVSLFWKDKLAATAAALTKHKVQITLEEKDGLICVHGTNEGLNLQWIQLQALSNQIVCHVRKVDDHLKVKFLTTDDCAKQLDIFERSSQCVLGISEEPNVIQVFTSGATVEEYTVPSCCSVGQGTGLPHSCVNQIIYRKLPSTNVIILDGNIADQQVDVIVNSTRHDLNLDSGGVSSAILAIGGQGLQDECRAKYPKGIQTQDIARTFGHGLPCKEVFHVALCPFKTPNAQQILETVVSNCLIQANESRYTSIAFPALGVGVRGYPSDIVSKTMNRAIDNFLKTSPVITISSIKVVIFNDKEMIKDYKKEFSDSVKQTVLPSKRQEGCVQPSLLSTTPQKEFKVETFWSGYMECTFGNLRLLIKPGDVIEEDVDAIVNSTTNNLGLKGTVSTILRTKCGAAFVEECKNKVSEIQDKGVCVTKAFNLKSKLVLHFNINKFQPDRLSEGFETLLKEAERWSVNTIALPAIGTGAGNISPAVLAEAMFQALVNFNKGKVQNVKEVRITLLNNEIIPPFVSQIQVESEKHRDKKRGIVKLLKGKANNSSPSDGSLFNTLHQVAKLYVYTADKKNVERLLDDFGGVVTRKFMRKMDTELVPSIKHQGPFLVHVADSPSNSNDKFKAGVKMPSTWADQRPNEKVKRVVLKPSHDEYKEVVKGFMGSLDKIVNIISVERIQNPNLYTLYSIKKEHIKNQNSDTPGIQNEKTLWHGTTINAIDNINHQGFNRSYCGKNATSYGEGVYFAVNSAYSASSRYSAPDPTGKRYIYQCKVLSGCPTKGDNSMKVLPSRSGLVLYDSATDDPGSPSLYVIFNDDQAYPEYLITFERSDKKITVKSKKS